MKKSIITFLCLMLITLSGCTYNTKYSESDAPLTITGGLSDTLIVYYSFNGEERELAKQVQSYTEGDLLCLQTSKKYSTYFKERIKEHRKEREAYAKALKENKHDYKNKHVLDTLPTLKNQIDDINQYKTVYLIYPCWEKDEPLIIDSFCMDYDLSGKTIVPMCISEKNWRGHVKYSSKKSVAHFNKMIPNANFKRAKAFTDVKGVKKWLETIDMI